MSPAASDLASAVTKELPLLISRLHKYDEQNFQLQLRYQNLEEEIARVRRSIASKQAQQVRLVDQLAFKDLGKGRLNLKRQRSFDQPELRAQRPRLESLDDQRISQLLFSDQLTSCELLLSSAESDLSLNSKRKGRVFQFSADLKI